MATMTQHATPLAKTHHHLATTAALVTLFWLVAAAAVATAHAWLDPLSPAGATVVTITAIVLCAYGYMRFCVRQAGISHTLGVGIAWLVLGIVSELVMTTRQGHGWYSILGPPDRPLLRNIFLFVWIFAPVLFARREGDR